MQANETINKDTSEKPLVEETATEVTEKETVEKRSELEVEKPITSDETIRKEAIDRQRKSSFSYDSGTNC